MEDIEIGNSKYKEQQSDISITLSCGHSVPFEKINMDCEKCKTQLRGIPIKIDNSDFPSIDGIVDENKRTRLEVHKALKMLNIDSKLYLDENGNMQLELVKENRVIHHAQLMRIVEHLKRDWSKFKVLANKSKPIIRILLDNEVFKQYFNEYGDLKIGLLHDMQRSRTIKFIVLGIASLSGLLFSAVVNSY